ncbi:hypothetical protein RRG08_037458 [Elysia crispata]|uniref:Uncharacterized protein n=1 Tax=Elysia crispata TaxID=231223 RepID=A0AAE1CMY5_9GAST|nr:hypothetical protein RRG08_037458 [Elysia crispata]
MEVMWTCRSCHGYSRTVCNKLEVYALAENPTSTVSEDTESGLIGQVRHCLLLYQQGLAQGQVQVLQQNGCES